MTREQLCFYQIETGEEIFKVEADFTISLHQITKKNFVFFSIFETDYLYYLEERWYKPIQENSSIEFFQIDEMKNEILIGSAKNFNLTLERLIPANFHELVCFTLFSGLEEKSEANKAGGGDKDGGKGKMDKQQLYLELLKTDTFYKIQEARYYELLEMFDLKEVDSGGSQTETKTN